MNDSCKKEESVEDILENNKQFIEFLIQHDNNYVYVEDGKNNTLVYISQNFCDFLGYNPSNVKIRLDDLFSRYIHPSDIMTFVDFRNNILEFTNTLSNEERMYYKHIFEFRTQLSEREWIRLISQHQLLGFSSDNTPVLLGIINISFIQAVNQSVNFHMTNIKTGGTISFPMCESFDNLLSKRELEILKLVSEGMLSREISIKLSISIHTVNGHRQKILQKMNVRNLTEAISMARKRNLLS
jgi:DNA-binding CsgD family transcriptional regulator